MEKRYILPIAVLAILLIGLAYSQVTGNIIAGSSQSDSTTIFGSEISFKSSRSCDRLQKQIISLSEKKDTEELKEKIPYYFRKCFPKGACAFIGAEDLNALTNLEFSSGQELCSYLNLDALFTKVTTSKDLLESTDESCFGNLQLTLNKEQTLTSSESFLMTTRITCDFENITGTAEPLYGDVKTRISSGQVFCCN